MNDVNKGINASLGGIPTPSTQLSRTESAILNTKLYYVPSLNPRQQKFYEKYCLIKWAKTLPDEYRMVSKAIQNAQQDQSKTTLSKYMYSTQSVSAYVMFNLYYKTKAHINELKYLLNKFNVVKNNQNLITDVEAKVLLTDLLWGNQFIMSNCKEAQTIKYYEECFRESFREVLDVINNPNDQKLLKLPSYIRINTLLISMQDCLTAFQKEGWILLPRPESYAEYLYVLSNLNEKEFVRDYHISELLAFPPGTNFYEHPGYLKGKFSYQDKGSCLSGFLLNPKPDSCVLDVCAAPGLKTNHIANIMENSGKIYAVDYHPHRFDRMKTYLEWTGVTNVELINDHYINIGNVIPVNDIRYILIDFSSSYSGIFYCMEAKKKLLKNKLDSLKVKQIKALKHCLFNYPNVKRVIYTVNSLYPEECEEVVSDAVRAVGDTYTLLNVKEMLWNQWESMSPPDAQGCENCLRIIPEIDLCEGYFIAVFERNFDVPIPEERQDNIFRPKPTMAVTKEILKDPPKQNKKLPKSYGFIELLQSGTKQQEPMTQMNVKNQEPEAKINMEKKVPKTQTNKNKQEHKGETNVVKQKVQSDNYKQRQKIILQDRMQKSQEKKMKVLAQKKNFVPNHLRWQNLQLNNQLQPKSQHHGSLPFPEQGLQSKESNEHRDVHQQSNDCQDVFFHLQSNKYQGIDINPDERQKMLPKLQLHEQFQNAFSQRKPNESQNMFSQSQLYERQTSSSQLQLSDPQSVYLQSSQNSNLISQTRPRERQNMYQPQLNESKNIYEQQNVFKPSTEHQNTFTQSSEHQNIFTPSNNRANLFTGSDERPHLFTPSSERQNIFTQSNERQSIFKPSNERQNVFISSCEKQSVFTPSNERENIFTQLTEHQSTFSQPKSYQNQNAFSSSYNDSQSMYQPTQYNRGLVSYPNSEKFFEKPHSQLWP